MRRRRRRRTGLLGLVLLVAVGFGFMTSQAFTASNAVPATNIAQITQSIAPSALEPAECISGGVTVTSIVSGTGTIASTAAHKLVLGSSANDTLNDSSFGSDCMVGGAGSDAFNGLKNGGDLCVVSAATLASSIKHCTVVATRP